jgi:hypothetical protein
MPDSTRLRGPSNLALAPLQSFTGCLFSTRYIYALLRCLLALTGFATWVRRIHNRGSFLKRWQACTPYQLLPLSSAWLLISYWPLCRYSASRLGRRFGICFRIGIPGLHGRIGRLGLGGPFLRYFATPSPSSSLHFSG